MDQLFRLLPTYISKVWNPVYALDAFGMRTQFTGNSEEPSSSSEGSPSATCIFRSVPESDDVRLLAVCEFAIDKLWDTKICDVCSAFRIDILDDLKRMLSVTREWRTVALLAIYYMVTLKRTNICDHVKCGRTVYIGAFSLATKYVDDYRVLSIKTWASFANMDTLEFNNVERNILDCLQYRMDPGLGKLLKLFTRLEHILYGSISVPAKRQRRRSRRNFHSAKLSGAKVYTSSSNSEVVMGEALAIAS